MEPTDLAVKILQEIREELKGQRADTQREFGQLRAEVRGEFSQVRAELAQMHSDFTARFEVIETTLKELAEQMVMLARGVKTALEVRGRMEEFERRLAEVEKREPH